MIERVLQGPNEIAPIIICYEINRMHDTITIFPNASSKTIILFFISIHFLFVNISADLESYLF